TQHARCDCHSLAGFRWFHHDYWARVSLNQRHFTLRCVRIDESCSNSAVQKSWLNVLLVIASVALTVAAAEFLVRWLDDDTDVGPAARHLGEIALAPGVERAWF